MSDTGPTDPTNLAQEAKMGTITPYETVKGRRYRVRYRKPDHTAAEKRGFTRMRDAQH